MFGVVGNDQGEEALWAFTAKRVADPSDCLSGMYHLFLFCVGKKPGEFFGMRLVHSIVGVGQCA